MRGRTVTLKVKYFDFQIITRSQTLPVSVADAAELSAISVDLLARLMPPKGIRLLGVTVSNLEAECETRLSDPQMSLAL